MSRFLIIAAAIIALLGLVLAFLAPTGNMGAQEAFFARLLLLGPSIICGLILFGFGAVVGAIERLEHQGEQLRLLLAARGEKPISMPIVRTGEAKPLAPEAKANSIFDRLRQPKASRAEIEVQQADNMMMDDPAELRAHPPARAKSLTPELSAAESAPAEKPQPKNRDDSLVELDTSFLERALRRPSADIAPTEPAPEPRLAAPEPRLVAEITEPEPPPARSAEKLPPISLPPLPKEPVAPAFIIAEPVAPPAQPIIAQANAPANQAPTIAELLERDLANWAEATEKPRPRVVKEGHFAGRAYRTFEDGSLEIDTEQSTLRFDSLEEFRNFVSNSTH